MKLSVKGLTLAGGIAWAFVMLAVGILNLIWPEYGDAFLSMVASLYPGFKASGTFIDVIVGTLYALVDGAICGFVFALLYNAFIGKQAAAKKPAAKKAPAKKPAAKKAPAKKAPAKKPAAKEAPAKKPAAKETPAKKPEAKKPPEPPAKKAEDPKIKEMQKKSAEELKSKAEEFKKRREAKK